MDRALRNGLLLLFLLFLVLTGSIFRISVLESKKLLSHPANARSLVKENLALRGRILDRNLNVLAETRNEDKPERYYPLGASAAHITGYATIRLGKAGLEASLDSQLSPPPENEFWLLNRVRGKDVRTTIDASLQRKAAELLTSPGAIVAVEPSTGHILALYSYPSFDPNKIDSDFERLSSDESSPLFNRATQGLYPPGSTLKILTLAAYLESGGSLEDKFDAPAVLEVGGFRIKNYGNHSYSDITALKAFSLSVNTAFAQMALAAGPEQFRRIAAKFHLDRSFSIPLPSVPGNITDNLSDKVNLAWSGVGQAEMLLTPLHAAMMVTAIARDGSYIEPVIIYGDQARSEQVLKPETAALIKHAMIECVKSGTGRRAQIPGIEVAGKTGTAEVEGKQPHAWFVGFAPADNPQIAVAVIIENGGSGGAVAAPVFRELVKSYLSGEN